MIESKTPPGMSEGFSSWIETKGKGPVLTDKEHMESEGLEAALWLRTELEKAVEADKMEGTLSEEAVRRLYDFQ